MLKEVRGRYSSKSGQEGGRLDAILPSKKKKKTKDYNGRKKKSDGESSIFSQSCFFKKSQLVFLTLSSISTALPFVLFLKHIVFRLAIALTLSTFYTETIQ